MRRMYSENQIKEMIENAPEQVVKALENQDVKVKTIEQSEANWSIDLSEISMAGLDESLEYTPIYERIEKIGNCLFIVATFKIKNPTESTIGIGNVSLSVNIDKEEIASKIIDFGGKALNETAPAYEQRQISADVGFKGDNSYDYALNRTLFKIVMAHPSQNVLQLTFYDLGNIDASKEFNCSVRTFLTLL